MRTKWSWDITPDQCVATAAAARTSLKVTIRRDAPIRLLLSLAEAPAGTPSLRLRFKGAAGQWQAVGQVTPTRQIALTFSADETGLGRILVLLNGGTLTAGEPPQEIPPLAIPASGTEGQNWFDCARNKLI